MEEFEKLRREISKEKMKKDKVLFKLSNFGRSIKSLVESENERAKHEAWKESLQNLSVEKSFDSGRTATISVWDFAGQQEYYPTHQLFLSKNCIVLLVSNISKGLDQNELQETVLYERNPKRKQILSEVQGKLYNLSISYESFTLIKQSKAHRNVFGIKKEITVIPH